MRYLLCAAILLFSAPAVLAQEGVAGSTNGYTAARRAQAEALAKAEGYTPTGVAGAQAGSLFLWATKGGKSYYLTVTPEGKVYAGGVANPDKTPVETLRYPTNVPAD
jgi:hypothetical protein